MGGLHTTQVAGSQHGGAKERERLEGKYRRYHFKQK